MTDTFRASNGIPVKLTDDRRLIVENLDGTYPATIAAGDHIDALREFFQHEKDEALGRWRWHKNPDWVVFPPEGRQGAFALNESTGQRGELARWEAELLAPSHDPLLLALAAYFDAHPEPKPAWHDAKVHEVWTVQHGRDEGYFPYRVVREGRTKFVYVDGDTWFYADDPEIGDARRIWPTEDPS